MTSSAVFNPGVGVIVSTTDGFSFVIPDSWTIAKLERHLKELNDWLG